MESFYKNQTLSFGVTFHSFKYPASPGEPLIACFTNTVMEDGVITFKNQDECEVKNELSTYEFKYPKKIKSVEDEFDELEE